MENKVYVGNLSYSVDSSKLEEMFSEHGTVESARVITDRDSGRSKGFGFVEMSSEEEVKKAIEALNEKEFDGRQLKVSIAKPQKPRDNRGGGGGRGRW